MHQTKEQRTVDFILSIARHVSVHETPLGKDYRGVGSFYEFEERVIKFLNRIHSDYAHGEHWKKVSNDGQCSTGCG
jgi:hypothetical protein